MKFRPQMQLRFRSEEQYNEIKDLASKNRESINEWVLRQIEQSNPGLTGDVVKAPEPKKVQPRAKKADVPATPACPHCKGTKTKTWGVGHRCDECSRNF